LLAQFGDFVISDTVTRPPTGKPTQRIHAAPAKRCLLGHDGEDAGDGRPEVILKSGTDYLAGDGLMGLVAVKASNVAVVTLPSDQTPWRTGQEAPPITVGIVAPVRSARDCIDPSAPCSRLLFRSILCLPRPHDVSGEMAGADASDCEGELRGVVLEVVDVADLLLAAGLAGEGGLTEVFNEYSGPAVSRDTVGEEVTRGHRLFRHAFACGVNGSRWRRCMLVSPTDRSPAPAMAFSSRNARVNPPILFHSPTRELGRIDTDLGSPE
jgi:hypothetical protein